MFSIDKGKTGTSSRANWIGIVLAALVIAGAPSALAAGLEESDWDFMYARAKITVEKAIDSPVNFGQVKAGAKLPALELVTDDGAPFDLAKYLAARPTVMVVFRNAWCGHCTWQVAEMYKVAPAMAEMGYQMIGVSSARPKSSDIILGKLEQKALLAEDAEALVCLEKRLMPFPLISDRDRSLGMALGITFPKCEGFVYATPLDRGPQYKWYPGRNDLSGFYSPSVFVFGTDGRIRYEFTHSDHKVRVSGPTLLAMARYALDAGKTVCWSLNDARANPEAVTRLDLSYQGLEEFPAEVAELPNLEDLRLNGNRLSALPPEIGKLTKLKRLELADNRLSELPPEIGRLTLLEDLQLWKNKLEGLPAEIGQLTSLKRLNLMYNPIAELPPEIGKLTDLKYLRLFEHRLSALPPEIGDLASLKHLFMPGTMTEDGEVIGLEGLPPEIGKLTELVELHLLHNRLKELPPEIGQLTSLGVLHLAENTLESLPPEIGGLTRVGGWFSEGFYLWGNRLKKLPPEMGDMKFIHLDVRYNELEELPAELAKVPSTWGGMWFSHNKLRAIPPEFGSMKMMRYLFDHNELTALPVELAAQKSIDVFDVSYNKLTSLPPEFGAWTKVNLNASHNLITAVPDEIALHIKRIDLSGNPVPPEERARIRALIGRDRWRAVQF